MTWSIWLLWVTKFLNNPKVFITTLMSESDKSRNIWSAPNCVMICTLIRWSDWKAMFMRPQTPLSLNDRSYLWVSWHRSSIAPFSTEKKKNNCMKIKHSCKFIMFLSLGKIGVSQHSIPIRCKSLWWRHNDVTSQLAMTFAKQQIKLITNLDSWNFFANHCTFLWKRLLSY